MNELYAGIQSGGQPLSVNILLGNNRLMVQVKVYNTIYLGVLFAPFSNFGPFANQLMLRSPSIKEKTFDGSTFFLSREVSLAILG